MPVWWFDTFRLATQDTTRSICLELWIGHHLIHVGIIKLNPPPHEFIALLFHCQVNACCVLKLQVRKIATDLVVTNAYLRDSTAVLEKLNKILFLRPALKPTYPDCPATFRFLLTQWPTTSTTTKTRPAARPAPTIATAPATSPMIDTWTRAALLAHSTSTPAATSAPAAAASLARSSSRALATPCPRWASPHTSPNWSRRTTGAT